jgi:hypothetical protein
MGIDLQLPLVSSRSEIHSLLLSAGSLGEAGVGVGLGVDALFGTEGLLDFDAIVTSVQDILIIRSVKIRGCLLEHQYITLCHTRA